MVKTMAKAIAKSQKFENRIIEIWPSKSPNFEYFQISNGQISVAHSSRNIQVTIPKAYPFGSDHHLVNGPLMVP